MTEEAKSLTRNRVSILEQQLGKRYQSAFQIQGGQQCFHAGGGLHFLVTPLFLPNEEHGAIVLEFASSESAARIPCFPDDGQLYFMDDMTEDEMLTAMIEEIEQSKA